MMTVGKKSYFFILTIIIYCIVESNFVYTNNNSSKEAKNIENFTEHINIAQYPYYEEALQLIKDKRYQEAIYMLNKVIYHFPNCAPAYYSKGLAFNELRYPGEDFEWDETIKAIDKAIELDPKYIDA